MKKIRFFIFACLFVVLVLIGGLTYAWIGDNGMTSPIGITAHLHKSYFESGDGSAEYVLDGNGNIVQSDTGPFEIKYPIQFYYLTWLQKLGYFNADEDNDGVIDKQYHFYLSADLDMSEDNFVLPPIGTHDNPFIGTFDGQGHIISNLTIENNNTNMTDPPEGGDLSNVEIIGLFGVVGSLPNTSYTFDSSENEIKDLYINNVNIKTSNTNALIGIAAGYVNASVSGVGVINSSIEFTKTHTALSYTSNLSDYSLIGYCTDEYKDSVHAERIELSEITETQYSVGEDDPGNAWGGSIDMLSMNKRIKYFMNLNVTSLTGTTNSSSPTAIVRNKTISANSSAYRYYIDDYQSYSTYNGSTYNKDPASNQIIYRFVGGASSAYASTSSSSGKMNYYFEIPASYFPLLTNGEDQGYSVAEGNTGYIAGDLMRGSNTVRTASYSNSYIQNSYANGELEVLSNSTVSYNASNYKRINNGHTNNLLSSYSADISPTKYPGYAAAYQKMCDVLSSATFVQGLHFTGNTISTSSTTTVPKAYINGQLINNYKTLRSSVDFYAKTNGSIKFFAGSYYNTVGTNADSFFSLHVVTRSGDSITTNQIYYIYANTNATTKKTYPHLYYDSNNNLISAGYGTNVTKGDLEFDMNWLHNAPPVANAVYYFEIPVNAGEFALGSVASNKTKGAYLMYLDLSANAATVVRKEVTETWKEEITTGEFPEGVAFVSAKGDTVDAIDSATFSLGTSASGKTTYSRTNDNITYTDTNGAQVGYVGDGITVNGNSVSSKTTILTERRTFYDSNQTSGEEKVTVTTTVITTNPDGTTTRTATQTVDGVVNSSYVDDNHEVTMGSNIAVLYFTDTSGASVTKSYDFNYKTAPSTYNVVITSDKTIKVHAQLLNNGYTVKLNNTNITGTDTEYTVSGS